MSRTGLVIAGCLAGAALLAQEPVKISTAKALDLEIEKLNDLPEAQRNDAIRGFVRRLREQPDPLDRLALADNLGISAAEATEPGVLQEVVDTLADGLRELPKSKRGYGFAFRHLAEFAQYDHLRVSLDDPRYAAEIARLADEDRQRGEANFTLADLHGRNWTLKELQGKVVVVNFWATWCPPCIRELPDFEAVYRRFEPNGLVILAITAEDPSVVRNFLSAHPVSYPILLDPGDGVKKKFLVEGVPKSFVFGRDGQLVGESIDRPSAQQLLEMLARAGLR